MTRTKNSKGIDGNDDFTRRAYLGIRQMMFDNVIKPGQKISYRELAERLGMSITPVIQALNQLELQELVRREPNKGYYMEPVTLKQIEEIYDLRMVIETSLLPGTIRRLDELGIHSLQKAFKNHLATVNGTSRNDKLLADGEFHITLASLSQCYTQERIIRHLYDLLYLKYKGSILYIEYPKAWVHEHERIFNCVLSRDLETAERALKDHIQNTKKHVIASLSKIIAEEEIADTMPRGAHWMDFDYSPSIKPR